MVEENKEIIDDNKEITEEGDNPSDIEKKAEKLTTEIYDKRREELVKIEARIDKKMKDFNEIVEAAQRQGIAFAGQRPPTQEEKDQAEADEIVKSFM